MQAKSPQNKKTTNYDPKLKFRYDINAIRAIAVISVMLYHYNVPYFSGGFAGVDIFFVISGYLMSKIIINSLIAERFSIYEFYGKRIKRIVPALLFLILILTLFLFFFYFPVDYQLAGKYATSSILFISNFYYWRVTDYFAPAARTNIFLHTWSLSVEWQFYLIYPLLLLFLGKHLNKRKGMTLIFAGVIMLIFFGSILLTRYKAIASFYLLPSRAWEMLFGGLAFYMEGVIKNYRIKSVTAILGYLVILLAVVFLNDGMAWPGPLTLVPVAATFLIIISDSNTFPALKFSIVQFFGKISYSLYLWHWPVFVIAAYFGFTKNHFSLLAVIATSIAMSGLSFKFIESAKISVKPILVSAILLCACTLITAFCPINENLFKKTAVELSNYKLKNFDENERQFSEGGCFIISPKPFSVFNKSNCLFLDPHKKNILLLGDSHAAHYFKSLGAAFEKQGVHLVKAAASDCLPVLSTHGAPGCVEMVNYIYNDFIIHHAKNIDGVIISAQWINHGDPEVIAKDLKFTIEYLEQHHIRVIILGQNKTFLLPYPVVAAKEYQFNISLEKNFADDNSEKVNNVLKRELGSHYIDIYPMDNFAKVTNGVPYMLDENHFTKFGADATVRLILTNERVESFIMSAEHKN